jgi:hypothetical protein
MLRTSFRIIIFTERVIISCSYMNFMMRVTCILNFLLY